MIVGEERAASVNIEQKAAQLFARASAEYPACVFGAAVHIVLALQADHHLSVRDLLVATRRPSEMWQRVATAADARHIQAGLPQSSVSRITAARAQEMATDIFTLAHEIRDASTETLTAFLAAEYPRYRREMQATRDRREKDVIQAAYINKLRDAVGLPAAPANADDRDFFARAMGGYGYE